MKNRTIKEKARILARSLLVFFVAIIIGLAVVFNVREWRKKDREENKVKYMTIEQLYGCQYTYFALDEYREGGIPVNNHAYLPFSEQNRNKLYCFLTYYENNTDEVLTIERVKEYLSSEYEGDGSLRIFTNGKHPQILNYINWCTIEENRSSQFYFMRRTVEMYEKVKEELGLQGKFEDLTLASVDELMKKEEIPVYEISSLEYEEGTKSYEKNAQKKYDVLIPYSERSLQVAVTYCPEIAIGEIYIEEDDLIFTYQIGAQQGKANVVLRDGKLRDYIDFYGVRSGVTDTVTSLALQFLYEDGKASLVASWQGTQSDGTDTFLFDTTENFWYFQQANSVLAPVNLNDDDFVRLFPNVVNVPTDQNSTFFCSEPIYDVRFYRVWDVGDKEEYPDVLLAQYDEYSNDNLFLWQSDSMFYWHLSIQYTDAAGEVHIFGYSVVSGVGSEPTILYETDEPDWDIEE